ncbi:unnamed protein product [Amoebophrya sp. A120]|nr:unnamed protein product [Amoebophrya sp. A120]|eukprot:GSA120T00025766001.1
MMESASTWSLCLGLLKNKPKAPLTHFCWLSLESGVAVWIALSLASSTAVLLSAAAGQPGDREPVSLSSVVYYPSQLLGLASLLLAVYSLRQKQPALLYPLFLFSLVSLGQFVLAATQLLLQMRTAKNFDPVCAQLLSPELRFEPQTERAACAVLQTIISVAALFGAAVSAYATLAIYSLAVTMTPNEITTTKPGGGHSGGHQIGALLSSCCS